MYRHFNYGNFQSSVMQLLCLLAVAKIFRYYKDVVGTIGIRSDWNLSDF